MRKLFNSILFNIAYTILWLYCRTWRYKFNDIYHSYVVRRAQGKSAVFAIWHCQMLPLIFSHRRSGMGTMASQSKEGDLIARVLKRLGYEITRGSSTRGGGRALVSMRRLIKNGHDAVITVDGPKGPRYTVKPGIILAAKQNGGVITPALINCKHAKRFNSWDRFLLPPPFAGIDITYAPPMLLSPDTDGETIERERAELEKYMLDCTNVYSSDLI